MPQDTLNPRFIYPSKEPVKILRVELQSTIFRLTFLVWIGVLPLKDAWFILNEGVILGFDDLNL